jgi:multicomponent Na+:H+ antiporter subunit E
MHHLQVIVPLSLVYLAITGNLEWRNLIMAILIATGISLLLRPKPRRLEWRRLPGALAAVMKFIPILLGDMMRSGAQVARIVLTPSLPIKPGIVAIPSQCDNPLGTALSAHAMSMTPGELVVAIDEAGMMYTHCLDIDNIEQNTSAAQTQRRELLEKMLI